MIGCAEFDSLISPKELFRYFRAAVSSG